MNHGLLTYTRTRNVGDDIQSIAAWQFLPRLDALADRDFLSEFRPSEPTRLIVNGWFSHRPASFDIREAVTPLFISMHINANPRASHARRAFTDVIRQSRPIRDLLCRHGPVGARDQPTYDFLKSVGVPSYLSGCLTLTLNREPGLVRGDDIVLVDVPPVIAERVRSLTERPVVELTHVLGRFTPAPHSFAAAQQVLRSYQRAHVVITTRLHVALPSLALGTPVLLVRDGVEDPRFVPLGGLVHRFASDELLRALSGRFLEDPPGNPSTHLTLRNELVDRVAAFTGKRPVAATEGGEAVPPAVSMRRAWNSAPIRHWSGFGWRWLRRTLAPRAGS
ncbi:MAG: polysaccharide pyruvyl transferase family protein [Rhizobiales bacterium]|nr:polysaccharide pyruvyl transferase family protein [Hyphomicrobiales bacterium]